ncbi:hypothetical protein WEI85_13185 [Actinomycetes bacterium KLBMP 9797]
MRTALDRVRDAVGGSDLLDLLGRRLPGADLTTLLLEVLRLRAARRAPAEVLKRYREDRFVAPAAVPFHRLRRVEDAVLASLPAGVEPITLAPLAPLGTHSVVAGVPQNNVVSTVRGTEVAADPTNGLALAAAHRRSTSDAGDVRLAAVQRVVRAQRFAAAPAHFSLFALVSAGRDTGNLAFERRHAAEQLRVWTDAMRALGAARTRVTLTTFEPGYAAVAAAVREVLSGRSDVEVVDDPARARGRGYYTGFCFKLYLAVDGEPFEVGDGGFVDWTRKLLGNRKERLLTSGIGIDRVALALP